MYFGVQTYYTLKVSHAAFLLKSCKVVYKLLYQAISRAREKLCVLIVENCKLFSDILNIKFDMLSRYQYKENNTIILIT